jgi:hypothetical protein
MGDNVIELEIASCPEANHPAQPLTLWDLEKKSSSAPQSSQCLRREPYRFVNPTGNGKGEIHCVRRA